MINRDITPTYLIQFELEDNEQVMPDWKRCIMDTWHEIGGGPGTRPPLLLFIHDKEISIVTRPVQCDPDDYLAAVYDLVLEHALTTQP